MCIATKNFESESKFKSKRMPKRVELSSLDNNCSFGNRSNGCSVKGNSKGQDYT